MPEFLPDTPDADHRHGARRRPVPLFETDRGVVRRCPCCDRLELRFGNALLALAPDDLEAVLFQIDAADRGAAPADGVPLGALGGAGPAAEARDEATMFLGDSGCGWVFGRGELAELHRLVAGARLMLDVGAPPA